MGEIESIDRSKKRIWAVISIVFSAVVLDQIIKLMVVRNFALGESHEVFSWFWICFVENNGMAFGIEWFSKLALTLFRLLAVGLLGWYIHVISRKPETPDGYIACIAFIIAGALGNIIDCVFYGKVVDMFYFPLIRNSAGEVIFFRPVFNFADSCITCAVIVILLFYMKEVSKNTDEKTS